MQIEELIWGNCYWLHPLIYRLIFNPLNSGLCKSRAPTSWVWLDKWYSVWTFWQSPKMRLIGVVLKGEPCEELRQSVVPVNWMEMVLNWFFFKTQTLHWASSGDSKHCKSLSNNEIKTMFCLQCVWKNNMEYYVL